MSFSLRYSGGNLIDGLLPTLTVVAIVLVGVDVLTESPPADVDDEEPDDEAVADEDVAAPADLFGDIVLPEDDVGSSECSVFIVNDLLGEVFGSAFISCLMSNYLKRSKIKLF